MDDLDSAQTCYFLVVASRKSTTASSVCLPGCLLLAHSLRHNIIVTCHAAEEKNKKKEGVMTQVGLELQSWKATFCMFLSLALYRNKTIVDSN